MNKLLSQTTNEYANPSGSNPSLVTAGLPSGSIMTPRLIQKNQNQATDNISNSQQYTIVSHRTISDTYLNLSRQDIDDVMTALHTLAQCVQDDIETSIDDNEAHRLTMLYSKSTNSSQANSSSHHYYYPRYSIRNKRHSLSSDRWLNHHHTIKPMYFYPVEEFQDDLYDMKCRQELRIFRQLKSHQKYFNHHNSSSYPSYSSNAILYTSTCGSNIQPRQIYHCSQQRQSTIKIPSEDQYQQSITKNLSSSTPLSSYILDKLVYINQKEPISSIQMLPQQAHTLQILQNKHLHSFMSSDSLNTKDRSFTPLTHCHSYKTNRNQTSGMGDQLQFDKIDVATQWSLQMITPEYSPTKSENTIIEMDTSKSDPASKNQDEQEKSELHVTHTNSTILTELSQSITTIATNNSTVNVPLLSKVQSFAENPLPMNDLSNVNLNPDITEMCLEKSSLIMNNDEQELTKSVTERFLTTLNIPTCKCSTPKLQTTNTNLKHSSMDDNITCISLENDSSTNSSSSAKRKKTNRTSIKLASKRARHHTSKSSKNNPTIKRARPRCRSQSYNRSMTIIQPNRKTDRKEDSSFDFFDIDTTFSDTYDRLFTDTTTPSEKSL